MSLRTRTGKSTPLLEDGILFEDALLDEVHFLEVLERGRLDEVDDGDDLCPRGGGSASASGPSTPRPPLTAASGHRRERGGRETTYVLGNILLGKVAKQLQLAESSEAEHWLARAASAEVVVKEERSRPTRVVERRDLLDCDLLARWPMDRRADDC